MRVKVSDMAMTLETVPEKMDDIGSISVYVM